MTNQNTTLPRAKGRPSSYDPAYCDRIVERQAQGYSLCEFAAEIGVARATLDNWAAAHPDFLEAMTRAKTAEQAWFERIARENLTSREFNAPVWKKSVEARFRHDYTERRETEHSGKLTLRHEDALAELE